MIGRNLKLTILALIKFFENCHSKIADIIIKRGPFVQGIHKKKIR